MAEGEPPNRYALRQAREKFCRNGLVGLCHAVHTAVLFVQSLAYARARGVTADLEALGNSLVKPDITVLLLLDEPERQRRLQARGSTPEDNETLDPVVRQQVHEILHSLADFKIDITGLTTVETQALLSKTVKIIG